MEIIKDFNPKLGEIDQKTVELLTKELTNQQINPLQVFNEAQLKAQAYLSSPQNPQPSI
jgi:transcriptional regulator of met regulon